MTAEARKFRDSDHVAKFGASVIATKYCAEYAGQPNNAIKALLRVLNNFSVTKHT